MQTFLTDEGALPFWFHSNQFGVIDPNSSNAILKLGIHRTIEPNSFFDYGVGIEPVGRFSDKSKLFFNQLYVSSKLGIFNAYVGKRQWRDGLFDSPMSLGSMIWSGNASTMPKVMLYMPEFVSIPWTHSYLAFKGYLGHGWFEKDRFVQNTFLHEKAFYLRLLPHDFWANVYIGAIHNVQWGGTHPTLGELPHGLADYWRVFAGKAGEANASPGGEVINALGNTVGAYEAMLELNFAPVDIKAYRQFYIETSVSARLRSPWDGIWGLQLNLKDRNIGIDQFIYEFVNTKRQNAHDTGEEIGADQYYGNFLYRSGWTYKGRVIGLPLVKVGTFNGTRQIVNNIILAHHIGVEGTLPIRFNNDAIWYQLMATYSRNYGRTTSCSGDFCDEGEFNPLRTPRQDQLYSQFKWGMHLSKNIQFWNSIGIDTGDLADEFGINFGISYSIRP